MRRTVTLATAVLVLLVAGCSAPPGASDAAISAWMTAHETPDVEPAPGEEVLGAATSRIHPDDPASTAGSGISQQTGDGVEVRVDRVLLSCLGEGTLDFTVETTGAEDDGHGGSGASRVSDVPCGGEPFEVAVDAADVTGFRVDADRADRAGAWHAVFLGAEN